MRIALVIVGTILFAGLLLVALSEAGHIVSASDAVYQCVGKVRRQSGAYTAFGAYVYPIAGEPDSNQYHWYGSRDEQAAFLTCMEQRGFKIVVD